MRKKSISIACIGLATLLASSCQTISEPFVDSESSTATRHLLSFASTLVELDSEQLAKRLEQTKRQWQNYPTAKNRAWLGMVRGQWGHAGYDPETAAADIEAALVSEPSPWDANGRAFLKQRMHQLRHTADLLDQQRSAAAENASLRSQLSQARAKLDAISEIEQELGSGNGEP